MRGHPEKTVPAAASTAPEPSRVASWMVVLAGVTAAVHVGKLPPALPVLEQALGVTLVQAGFLLSLVQLAGMLLGLAVGLMADGLGLRRSMLAGLLTLSAASALGGWAQDAASLLLLRTVEGFGVLLAAMPAPSLIRRLVPAPRLPAMLGVWGAYMPIGTASALLLGPWLMAGLGWRAWWWGLALLSLCVAVAFWRLVPADPPAPVLVPPGGGAAQRWPQRLRQTLAAPGPWLVALCFAMYSGQWLAVVGFLPSVYAQAGIAGTWSAVLTAAVAGINMVGNIVSGRLLQRGVAAERLLYVGFVTMGLGAVCAFAAVQGQGLPPAGRYLAVLLFSMVGGMIPGTLFSLAVALAPGERTVSTTVGWVQQWSSLGQMVGPPLVAWVASAAGGWQWTWAVTGACAAGGLLLAGLLGRQVQRKARAA